MFKCFLFFCCCFFLQIILKSQPSWAAWYLCFTMFVAGFIRERGCICVCVFWGLGFKCQQVPRSVPANLTRHQQRHLTQLLTVSALLFTNTHSTNTRSVLLLCCRARTEKKKKSSHTTACEEPTHWHNKQLPSKCVRLLRNTDHTHTATGLGVDFWETTTHWWVTKQLGV